MPPAMTPDAINSWHRGTVSVGTLSTQATALPVNEVELKSSQLTSSARTHGVSRTAENAAIIRAGNLLFALKDDGELIIADGSNPKTFTPLRRYQVSDSATWAAPSLSGNRLFVKNVSTLALWTIE